MLWLVKWLLHKCFLYQENAKDNACVNYVLLQSTTLFLFLSWSVFKSNNEFCTRKHLRSVIMDSVKLYLFVNVRSMKITFACVCETSCNYRFLSISFIEYDIFYLHFFFNIKLQETCNFTRWSVENFYVDTNLRSRHEEIVFLLAFVDTNLEHTHTLINIIRINNIRYASRLYVRQALLFRTISAFRSPLLGMTLIDFL